MFKLVADNWAQEAGVENRLHAIAVGAIRDGDSLKGVIESKSVRQAILAKRTIDATGDADIAALRGVPQLLIGIGFARRDRYDIQTERIDARIESGPHCLPKISSRESRTPNTSLASRKSF